MFKEGNFTLVSTKWAHFKQVSKKLARGNKQLKKQDILKKIQLGEHLATNWVNWHQVCNMISYKRDVLERQSLSEVKMGRGSQTILNVKLQRLCKSHHLQCITSSKDSQKLEKSLCVRNKAEDLVGCPWSSGPQTTLHHSSAWFCHWHY